MKNHSVFSKGKIAMIFHGVVTFKVKETYLTGGQDIL